MLTIVAIALVMFLTLQVHTATVFINEERVP